MINITTVTQTNVFIRKIKRVFAVLFSDKNYIILYMFYFFN